MQQTVHADALAPASMLPRCSEALAAAADAARTAVSASPAAVLHSLAVAAPDPAAGTTVTDLPTLTTRGMYTPVDTLWPRLPSDPLLWAILLLLLAPDTERARACCAAADPPADALMSPAAAVNPDPALEPTRAQAPAPALAALHLLLLLLLLLPWSRTELAAPVSAAASGAAAAAAADTEGSVLGHGGANSTMTLLAGLLPAAVGDVGVYTKGLAAGFNCRFLGVSVKCPLMLATAVSAAVTPAAAA